MFVNSTLTVQREVGAHQYDGSAQQLIQKLGQSKGYESDDKPVLRSVVLVLVLGSQTNPGTVVGLAGCKTSMRG